MKKNTVYMTKKELVAEWRKLSRTLANETMPDQDWQKIKEDRDYIQARIDYLDRLP